MRQLTTYIFGLTLLLNLTYLDNSIAQKSNVDSLLIEYSKNIIGTWVREYSTVVGRQGQKDTVRTTYDTLKFTNSKKYSWCMGAGKTESKNWIEVDQARGHTRTGAWKIARTSDYPALESKRIILIELLDNIVSDELGLIPNPVFQIVSLSKTEFSFDAYKDIHTYRKVD